MFYLCVWFTAPEKYLFVPCTQLPNLTFCQHLTKCCLPGASTWGLCSWLTMPEQYFFVFCVQRPDLPFCQHFIQCHLPCASVLDTVTPTHLACSARIALLHVLCSAAWPRILPAFYPVSPSLCICSRHCNASASGSQLQNSTSLCSVACCLTSRSASIYQVLSSPYICSRCCNTCVSYLVDRNTNSLCSAACGLMSHAVSHVSTVTVLHIWLLICQSVHRLASTVNLAPLHSELTGLEILTDYTMLNSLSCNTHVIPLFCQQVSCSSLVGVVSSTNASCSYLHLSLDMQELWILFTIFWL